MSPEPTRRTRRSLLKDAAHGFGAIALQHLLVRDGIAAPRVNPLAAKPPHFTAKAKSVIFLFMVGAPSQIDTFDPKPLLKSMKARSSPKASGRSQASSQTATRRSCRLPGSSNSTVQPEPGSRVCIPTSPGVSTTSPSSAAFTRIASSTRPPCIRFKADVSSWVIRLSARG
jgi:hypothetical protein